LALECQGVYLGFIGFFGFKTLRVRFGFRGFRGFIVEFYYKVCKSLKIKALFINSNEVLFMTVLLVLGMFGIFIIFEEFKTKFHF